MQNVTYDLTGSGIPGDNGTNFFTKYDYSSYTQFFQAETMYGSQYAVSAIDPSTETLTGGPTKQELAWTDPGILNLEFLSDHYGIDGTAAGRFRAMRIFRTQGVQSTPACSGHLRFKSYIDHRKNRCTDQSGCDQLDPYRSRPNSTDTTLIAERICDQLPNRAAMFSSSPPTRRAGVPIRITIRSCFPSPA